MSVETPKRAAREIVVADRMPGAPKVRTGNPFTSLGDLVADCQVEGCGYHVAGPRALVGDALKQHHRLFHSEATSVVFLNHARQ